LSIFISLSTHTTAQEKHLVPMEISLQSIQALGQEARSSTCWTCNLGEKCRRESRIILLDSAFPPLPVSFYRSKIRSQKKEKQIRKTRTHYLRLLPHLGHMPLVFRVQEAKPGKERPDIFWTQPNLPKQKSKSSSESQV